MTLQQTIQTKKINLTKKIMADNKLSVSFSDPEKIDFILGDFYEYDSEKYYLNRPASITKGGKNLYNYSLTLESSQYKTLEQVFLFEGVGDFPIIGDVEFFMDLLLQNLNDPGFDSGWIKGTFPVTESKNITFNNVSCREAINQIVSAFNVEFEIIDKTLNFATQIGTNTGLTFEYGKGKGLYQLDRKNVDSKNTITKVYGIGSDRNLPTGYRAKRLKFTGDFLQDTSQFGRVVAGFYPNDEIYPRFTGTVSAVSSDLFTITVPTIDFNINDYLNQGVTAKVVFKTGELLGKEFEIQTYDHSAKTIKLIKSTDAAGYDFPRAEAHANIGDELTLIDLQMPISYVTNAENELKVATQVYLDENKAPRVEYTLTVSPQYFRTNKFDAGDIITLIDADLGINRDIRVVSIAIENIEYPIKITASISDYIPVSDSTRATAQIIDSKNGIINEERNATEKQRLLNLNQQKSGSKVFRGSWASDMVLSNNRYNVDVVDSGDDRYLYIGPDQLIAPVPPSKEWELIPNYGIIATDLLFATLAYIENLGVQNLKTADTGQRIEMTAVDNSMRLFDSGGVEKILMSDSISGTDLGMKFNDAILWFENGNFNTYIRPEFVTSPSYRGGGEVVDDWSIVSGSPTQLDDFEFSNTYYAYESSGSTMYVILPDVFNVEEGTQVSVGTGGRNVTIQATTGSPLRWDTSAGTTTGTYSITGEVEWIHWIKLAGAWTRVGSGNF